MKKDLLTIHDQLLQRFGPQHWWPADTPFEVIVGAILTQSTSWKNVEKALGNLKNMDALNAESLHKIGVNELAALIKPAGYYNSKARKLKEFMDHLYGNHAGDLADMLETDGRRLRNELLSIWGIGPETADSIVLYAAGKPEYVVDAYTKRIFTRLGYVKENIDYADLKKFSEQNLPRDAKIYNEFHALLVKLGKDYCRKTKPACSGCPLDKRCMKKGLKEKRKV